MYTANKLLIIDNSNNIKGTWQHGASKKFTPLSRLFAPGVYSSARVLHPSIMTTLSLHQHLPKLKYDFLEPCLSLLVLSSHTSTYQKLLLCKLCIGVEEFPLLPTKTDMYNLNLHYNN